MSSDLLDAINETPTAVELSDAIQNVRLKPERWLRRAQLSAGMGEFSQARADLERALDLDPACLPARLELLRVDAQLERLTRELYEQDPWLAVNIHGPSVGLEPRRRGFFETHLAQSVPSLASLEAITTWVAGQTVLEVSSGKGLWARLLRDSGVEILATEHPTQCLSPMWMPVTPLTPDEAVRTLAADVLMLDGPAHGLSATVLMTFKGKALIIRGSIAPHLLPELDANWTCVHSLQIPSWTLTRDTVRFLIRRQR